MKIKLCLFALGDVGRIFVGDPTRVDAVHVDAVADVVLGRSAGHHVERRFCHVRVRVLVGFVRPIEDAFHRRDVDDVLVSGCSTGHQWF